MWYICALCICIKFNRHWPVRKPCPRHCWGQWVGAGCGHDCKAPRPHSRYSLKRRSQNPAETPPTACHPSQKLAGNPRRAARVLPPKALPWKSSSRHHHVPAVNHTQTTQVQTRTAFMLYITHTHGHLLTWCFVLAADFVVFWSLFLIPGAGFVCCFGMSRSLGCPATSTSSSSLESSSESPFTHFLKEFCTR